MNKGLSNLEILQKTCEELLFDFDSVCREKGLKYYLAWGSLLGAVRHQGFIPWDDDIDLLMPRNEMQYIIDNFDNLFGGRYRINHYSKPGFTTNSFVLRICNPKVQIKRNIGGEDRIFDSFISIFPMCGMPKGSVKQKIFEYKANFEYIKLRFIRSANNGLGSVHRSALENIGIFLNNIFKIGKNKSTIDCVGEIDKLLSKYPYNNTDVVGIHSFCYNPFIYKEKWFGTPVLLPFSGHMLPAPAEYDKILRIFYGDYMQLPLENERIPQHGIDIIINN